MKIESWRYRLLLHAPIILLCVVLGIFSLASPQFFSVRNFLNIGVQASSVGVVSVGMTFVLLTGGVDLSVGAIMFVGAAVAGKVLQGGLSTPAALVIILPVGGALGLLNAWFITRARMAAFIVTLSFLFVGRGFALLLTQTRAMTLPDGFLQLSSIRFLGLPLPLVVFAAIAAVAHVVLTRTPFGRQIYAIGYSAEAARQSGVNTQRILTLVYLLSGLCAALGAIITMSQLGTVSPKFGENYEFKAISAVVLGGTSLFGGRGGVWPGTVVGAIFIQAVDNGLVLLNVDPYLYPLITSVIIFTAVFIDCARNTAIANGFRRKIFS